MSKFLTDLQEQLNQVNTLRTATTEKSGVDCSNKTIEEIAGVVSEIPAPKPTPKDINFYNYDGELLFAYTIEEMQTLENLPTPPTDDKLQLVEWNYTLDELKQIVIGLDVSGTWATISGNTEIDKEFNAVSGYNSRISLYNNDADRTFTVTWIDGTQESHSFVGSYAFEHTYAEDTSGTEIVQISGGSTSYCLYGNFNNRLSAFEANNNVNGTANFSVKAVRLGNFAVINNQYSNSPLCNCKRIDYLTQSYFDNSTMFTENDLFGTELKNLNLPNGYTGLSNYVFANNYCTSLQNYFLPKTITSINYQMFSNNTNVAKIFIPKNASHINTFAFRVCWAKLFDFSAFTTIPTLDVEVFANISPFAKIVVPDELYDQWIIAENWSAYVQYIIKASDYKAVQNANN